MYFQSIRGHALPPLWVFGMVDTGHIPGLGYMELVDQSNTATILPIITDHILPRETVSLDKWAACNTVWRLPGVASHDTVNYSIKFVNLVTGANTNTIEAYWNR